MKFELSIDREIEFMNKYSLTADELFLMKLIFYAQEGKPKYLSDYFTSNKLGLEIRDLLQNLQKKGIINKTYKIPDKGTVFNPNDVEFNKNVIKSIYQHSEDLGMELFEAYPSHTFINGKVFSLRNIAKSFKDFDDFCFYYGKTIKFDLNTHQEILELLEFAKNNNLIHSGICDFVLSRQWTTIEILRDEDLGTFNTNELV